LVFNKINSNKIMGLSSSSETRPCVLCEGKGVQGPGEGLIYHICIDKKCGRSFFDTTQNIVHYFVDFFYLTLSEQKYLTLLQQRYKNKRPSDPIYKEAWKIFVENIISEQNTEYLRKISNYYLNGYGARKDKNLSDIFLKLSSNNKLDIESIECCPVCFVNKKDGDDSVLCSVCGNMLCGMCYEKLFVKKCPSCRYNLAGRVSQRLPRFQCLIRKGGKISRLARKNLIIIYIFGPPGSIDHGKAYKIASRSVAKGEDECLCLLAIMHMNGMGCIKNIKLGIDLLTIGVQREQNDCNIELAKCYMTGKGVKKDNKTGFHYLTEAAKRGNFRSIRYLMERN